MFKMLYVVYFLLTFVCVGIKGDAVLTVFPEKPNGVESENFEIRADLNGASFQSCIFTIRNYNVSKAGSNDEKLFYEENEEKSLCKLIMRPAGENFKGQWNIEVTVNETMRIFKNFSFGCIIPKPVETNRTVLATEGAAVNNLCSLDKLTYAKVYNPNGELVEEGPNAGIMIPFLRVVDEGIWRCDVQFPDRVNQLSIYIDLKVSRSLTVDGSVTETETEVQLLCPKPTVPYACTFESPKGTLFSPIPGVVIGRYSYFGNETAKECGFAIAKPLLDEDLGAWRCQVTSPEDSRFLQVGDVADISPSTRTPSISLVHGDDLTIQCNMRRQLTYCFLRSSMERVFSSNDHGFTNYTGLGLQSGDCQITVAGGQIWKNESGSWKCGMGSANFEDTEVPVHVNVAGSEFIAIEPDMLVNNGDNVTIFCQSPLRRGLRYCRFVHASGKSYNLNPAKKALGRFSYVGQGLDKGQCGLQINNIEYADMGEWTCTASFIGDQWTTEISDKIVINYSPMSLVATIAISIVLGLVAAVAVTGLVWWRRRRQSRRTSIFHVSNLQYIIRSHRSSESSETTSNNGLYLN